VSRPARVSRFLLDGHLVPFTLVALYLAPALLGLYAFRDSYAQLVASALIVSIVCYYCGLYGAAFAQRAWLERRAPFWRKLHFSPVALQRAALGLICAYGVLVLYLIVTSRDIALLAALRSADVTEITAAREAFVQTRTGGEAVVRYLNAILFRVPVPFALLILYAYGNRWRHFALAAMLLCALISLEKSLTAFILVPLGVYFLMTGRTRAVTAFVLAGALVLAATVLSTGVLSELRGRTDTEQTKLLTDSWGERKNMFWVLEWLAAAGPGKPFQDVLQQSRPAFDVSEQLRLVPATDEAGRPGDGSTAGETAARTGTGATSGASAPSPDRPAATDGGASHRIAGTFDNASPTTTDASEAPPPDSPRTETGNAVPPGPRVGDAETWRTLQYRNLIANGDMRITEIARGRAYAAPHSAYVAARWLAVLTVGRKLTFEQSEDAPPGFTHSLKVTVADAYEPDFGDVFEVQQRIEGFKVADLALGSSEARTMALSFWVKASLAGVYNATLSNGRWTRSWLAQYEVLKANEWEHKIIVARGDSGGGPAAWPAHVEDTLVVNFNLGTGRAYRSDRANEWQSGLFRQTLADAITLVEKPGATLQLTGVQLEAGSEATDFERRSLDDELALVRTAPSSVGGGLLKSVLGPVEPYVAPLLEDYRVQALLRRTLFIVNRIVWIPYITAYDWFRFHHEILEDGHLRGRTIGIVSRIQGEPRYPIEQEVFKYQHGVFATATATANAVYFADAYVNFGWIGIVVYSLLIGAIFHVVVASRSLPLLAVSVMSTFSLMIASFPANLLSGGLALLLLLAWMLREPPAQRSPA
jgi:hypothetical protein